MDMTENGNKVARRKKVLDDENFNQKQQMMEVLTIAGHGYFHRIEKAEFLLRSYRHSNRKAELSWKECWRQKILKYSVKKFTRQKLDERKKEKLFNNYIN